LHFSGPTNPFYKGRRQQTREILTKLFGSETGQFGGLLDNNDFYKPEDIKKGLYAQTETTLQQLNNNLNTVLQGGENSAEALSQLLTSDNPIRLVLLKNPQKFREIINQIPNTEESLESIEQFENALLEQRELNSTSSLYSVAIHEICFERKTEIFEDVISSKLANENAQQGFNALKNLGKENYWKILIDGEVHGENNKHLYNRSRGYMASMMKGLNYIVTNRNRLDIDYVKDLHSAAVNLVTTEGAFPQLTNPNFTRPDPLSLPMTQKSFQKKGIKESPNAWGVRRDHTLDGWNEMKDLRKKLDGWADKHDKKGNYFQDDEGRYSKINRVIQWRTGGKRDVDKIQSVVEGLMEESINHMYTQIDNIDPQLEQEHRTDLVIGEIVDCCRRLGAIHPFQDANGRVIMFLVLNKLLMENNLSPTILDRQGDMIGQSKERLKKLIKQGQERLGLGIDILFRDYEQLRDNENPKSMESLAYNDNVMGQQLVLQAIDQRITNYISNNQSSDRYLSRARELQNEVQQRIGFLQRSRGIQVDFKDDLIENYNYTENGVFLGKNYTEDTKPKWGWKIHISPDLASIPRVHRLVLNYLRENQINHKVVGSIEEYDGWSETGDSQAGKYITIYAPSDVKPEPLNAHQQRMLATRRGSEANLERSRRNNADNIGNVKRIIGELEVLLRPENNNNIRGQAIQNELAVNQSNLIHVRWGQLYSGLNPYVWKDGDGNIRTISFQDDRRKEWAPEFKQDEWNDNNGQG
jgi:hypothetical protein